MALKALSVAFDALPREPDPWVAGYIGLPWGEKGRARCGLDCWGLLALVMAERFGVAIPLYDGAYDDVADRDELARLIAGGMAPWAPVWERRGFDGWPDWRKIRAGDGALFVRQGQPCHVGMIVARERVLHIEEGKNSICERIDGFKWRRRLVGIYRWGGAEALA